MGVKESSHDDGPMVDLIWLLAGASMMHKGYAGLCMYTPVQPSSSKNF